MSGAPVAEKEPVAREARRCVALFLGRVGYREAAELQERCAASLKRARLDRGAGAPGGTTQRGGTTQPGGPARPAGAPLPGRSGSPVHAALEGGPAVERLLLLEHPPVITLGRNARAGDILAGRHDLQNLGVAVETTNRGGQVTYHGPGQLVGYPILDLNPDRRDVGRYLRDLEEVLIRTLGRLGITAGRRPGWTGVWVEERKIASIGVHLSRWVTTHGFALNVSTDLSRFDLIVPCGIRDRDLTSMERLTGNALALQDVADVLVPEFGGVFGREMIVGAAAPAGVVEAPRAAAAPVPAGASEAC